jgi:hypothetical protein
MKQTVCDICEEVIIKDNDCELKIYTNKVGNKYEDICKHCADRITRLITEIHDRPRAVCGECGHSA